MANKLLQAFIDTAKTIAGYPITVANAVFMRNGKTLDETQEEFNTILGTTDISKYGDGTVTGAVKSACDKANANEAATADVNNKLGNTDISAIGDGTVTGGLDALNSNFSNLIKTYTETLTTNESGIFSISLNIDRPLLAIKCITNNDVALIPYSNENAGYGNWIVSSYIAYAFTRFSNQTITVKYWYI